MNQRNLVSAIDKLLDVKQDIGDLLSESPALVESTENDLMDAIDRLIAELYTSSRKVEDLDGRR